MLYIPYTIPYIWASFDLCLVVNSAGNALADEYLPSCVITVQNLPYEFVPLQITALTLILEIQTWQLLCKQSPLGSNLSIRTLHCVFRLAHAKQRRLEQVRRWDENERMIPYSTSKSTKKGVQFQDSVTLLEAAARDDYHEGNSS